MVHRRTGRRFPLHIHITTLFVLLIVGFGALVSWLQYRDSSKLILKASETLFDRVADEAVWSFRSSHQSVGALVELLALSALTQAETLEERQKSLPQLSLALSHNPQMATLQIGYKDGDYFIVRKVEDDAARAPFEAPAATRYMIDHIETDSGVPMQQRLFFSEQLALLEQVNMGQVEYDPRQRPWYQKALQAEGNQTTDPYLFYFMRQLGVTLVRNSERAVVSADITLSQLSDALAAFELSPSAQLLLVSPDGAVLAYPGSNQALHQGKQMTRIEELEHPVLQALGSSLVNTGEVRVKVAGQEWLGRVKSLRMNDQMGARLVMLAPKKELLAEAYAQQWRNLIFTLALLAAMVPLTWYLANRIARPLHQLASEARKIQRFDFSSRALPETHVVEIAQLNDAVAQMKETINRFLQLTHALAAEPDLKQLQQQVVDQTREVSHADGALLWLIDEETQELYPACANLGAVPFTVAQLPQRLGAEKSRELLSEEKTFQLSREEAGDAFAELYQVLDSQVLEVHRLPLKNRAGESLGVLNLFSKNDQPRTSSEAERTLRRSFLGELSGFAAVTIESGQLLEAQKNLLEAFIKLLASAIDAKSPYTGGHCQRVPELSKMLAQAACDSEQNGFADYQLDEQGWEQLHIASWLHDCGKVTTPEFVVDKATKLETLYDRIHEVRMRFEVLKRDAQLRYWQARAEHPEAAFDVLKQQLDEELETLDQEFAFIAESNLGGEFMAPERIERLQQIASRTWQRTLDDRAGISHEELGRREGEPVQELPVTEQLLADKPWHCIAHDARSRIDTDNPWGFNMAVPEQKYNRGELYNLGIERGTLTAEERYRINDHIVQTIIMLEQLPFPKHLKQVPEIAGGHHEQINGSGYPRGLTGGEMSLTARMIAIADVFEALTASDRPYKPAKKLSQALKIMHFMCRDGHLDSELFHLFLDRGIPERYAEAYLSPEQIDPIDPEAYKVSV